ncbi:hypothetical protein BS015_RS19570 [Vibrio parahaemolyticus]|uniref:DUF3892 domain-containing protein n=1 Tax=Vibrio TaxID=662 RepID=UPI000BA96F7C|nr:hypothetical protein [Vibrio parahaemolyticus]PAR52189.1 hypothetical protein CGT93_18165 [Vibrio metoecus]EII5645455.1 hypothetical protein [Vibrio parahaemolyticus]EJC6807343.1 hypothetical protein [Vibrio parahaemolyticus]EJC6868152.1 hypothetical protein [Vibrio parahaemolyticus]
MGRKRVTTTQESNSGRNTKFRDNYTGESLTRSQFVKKIESGEYSKYHVREINGVKTPVSNPDPSKDNNLG